MNVRGVLSVLLEKYKPGNQKLDVSGMKAFVYF